MSTTRLPKIGARLLGTLAVTLLTFGGVSAAAQAQEVQDPVPPPSGSTGCPVGAVCVYPDDDWNSGDPTYVFWSYDPHRIYDQYGEHRVYNNQTGLAYAELCTGTGGENCDNLIGPGDYTDINLTEVNSINLFTY